MAIGPDSYHAMKLSFALPGLVGIYLFYRAAELLLGRSAPWAFWALLLYPQHPLLVDDSGKDPLILAAIALNTWGLVEFIVRRQSKSLVAVLVACAASAVRIWMGPILILPCLLILGLRIQSPVKRFVAALLVGLTLRRAGSCRCGAPSIR